LLETHHQAPGGVALVLEGGGGGLDYCPNLPSTTTIASTGSPVLSNLVDEGSEASTVVLGFFLASGRCCPVEQAL